MDKLIAAAQAKNDTVLITTVVAVPAMAVMAALLS